MPKGVNGVSEVQLTTTCTIYKIYYLFILLRTFPRIVTNATAGDTLYTEQ